MAEFLMEGTSELKPRVAGLSQRLLAIQTHLLHSYRKPLTFLNTKKCLSIFDSPLFFEQALLFRKTPPVKNLCFTT